MIDVKKFIKQNADIGYANFNRKFISSNYEIVGVRIPLLKKFAKEIEPEFVELDGTLCHEEILLYGFAASCINNEDEQIEYLKNILPFIDNWCTCDCIVSSLKKLQGQKSYNFFTNLLHNENQFYVRVGIVGLMNFFMKREQLPEILENFGKIKCQEYYVKMALAWFYATLCAQNFEIGKNAIEQITDSFIKSKAISKAKESLRISQENKIILSNLKR